MTLPNVDISTEQFAEFCRRWQVRELALFGSVLREDFAQDSDVDVLVDFQPGTRWTLFDHIQMQDELRELFGRDVDLVTKRGLERSRNHLRRKAVFDSAEVIYSARLEDETGIKVIPAPKDPIAALRGRGKGEKLVQKLLTERRRDRECER